MLFVVAYAFFILMSHATDKAGVIDRKAGNMNPFLWILSPFMTVAAAVIAVFDRIFGAEESRFRKIFYSLTAILLFVLIITTSGKRVVSDKFFAPNDNAMHLPTGLSAAMDTVLADCADASSDNPIRIICQPGCEADFLNYSSKLEPYYETPKNGNILYLDEYQRTVYKELEVHVPHMKELSNAAHKGRIQYIVLMQGYYWPEFPLTDFGYDKLADVSGWEIYKLNPKVREW